MKKLIVVLSCVTSVGALTAMGVYAPSPRPAPMEYQPKPGVLPALPRVLQDAPCSPTPPNTPGGHPKKPKVPLTIPNK